MMGIFVSIKPRQQLSGGGSTLSSGQSKRPWVIHFQTSFPTKSGEVTPGDTGAKSLILQLHFHPWRPINECLEISLSSDIALEG